MGGLSLEKIGQVVKASGYSPLSFGARTMERRWG